MIYGAHEARPRHSSSAMLGTCYRPRMTGTCMGRLLWKESGITGSVRQAHRRLADVGTRPGHRRRRRDVLHATPGSALSGVHEHGDAGVNIF